MSKAAEAILDMAHEIDSSDTEILTQWEIEFVAGFIDNPNRCELVSDKQRKIMGDIWGKTH